MKPLFIFGALCLLFNHRSAEGLENENETGVLIVGGRGANHGEIPYHLSLLKNNTNYMVSCGAVLVEVAGHQVGLTSSSCFDNTNTSIPWNVRAGYTNVYELENTQQAPIEKIVKHPSYKVGAVTNDIAIIFFQPFGFNDTVNTVPFPRVEQTVPQGNMTVSGWGGTEFVGSPSQPYLIRVLNVTVVKDVVCEQDFGLDLMGVFCARSEEAKATPYIGDDGGPAVSHEGYLAGIFLKAEQNKSAIFTDVAYFMTWIEATVKEYYPPTSPTTVATSPTRKPSSIFTSSTEDYSQDPTSSSQYTCQSNAVLLLMGLLLSVVMSHA